uniref:Endonuclease/exonuclease/phosphatase domain-containing protein n=1 Tax=Ceratitis capitata TaxID=7213 RepID=W8BIB7_CERCA
MIGGDLNAKSSTWGAQTTNSKGSIVENIATDNEFYCLNDGTPTFTLNNISSAVDATSINNCIRYTWKTYNKITNSNHKPIIITLTDRFTFQHKPKKIITANILKDITILKIGPNFEEVNREIQRITKKHTINKDNNKYVPKQWWTEESQKLFRLRNAARNKYNQYKTIENNNILYTAERNLRIHIKEQKKKNFNKTLEELSETKNIKEMWSKINNIKKYQCEKSIRNSWNPTEQQKYLEFIARSPITSNINNQEINSPETPLEEMSLENFKKLHTKC